MADGLFKSIGPVDDLPLFKIATAIVMEAPGKIAAVAVAAGNGIMDMADRATEGFKNTVMSVSDSVKGLAKDTPSIEIAKAPEISAPAPSRAAQHEVNMADIGTFSPPAFSVASIQSEIGRG